MELSFVTNRLQSSISIRFCWKKFTWSQHHFYRNQNLTRHLIVKALTNDWKTWSMHFDWIFYGRKEICNTYLVDCRIECKTFQADALFAFLDIVPIIRPITCLANVACMMPWFVFHNSPSSCVLLLSLWIQMHFVDIGSIAKSRLIPNLNMLQSWIEFIEFACARQNPIQRKQIWKLSHYQQRLNSECK